MNGFTPDNHLVHFDNLNFKFEFCPPKQVFYVFKPIFAFTLYFEGIRVVVTSKLMLQVEVGTVELSLSLHVSPLDEHYTAEASRIFPYFVISFYQFQFLHLAYFLMISIKKLLELFFLFYCIRNFVNVFLFFYYSVQYIQIVYAIG